MTIINALLVMLSLLEKPNASKILEFTRKEKKEKRRSRSEYFSARKNQHEEKNKSQNEYLISRILSSNIVFSKHGWVAQAAELLGKKPQKVSGWMKKYMKDFYEEECYTRRTKAS